MAQQTEPNGKCLSSCVLSAQVAAHPQEGDFVGGELVMSCETSLCFTAGQHKISTVQCVLQTWGYSTPGEGKWQHKNLIL